MKRLSLYLILLTALSGCAIGAESKKVPVHYDAGSSFTLKTGGTATFEAGSYVNVTGANLVGFNFQPLDADLTFLAGLSLSPNVKSLIASADYAGIQVQLAGTTAGTLAAGNDTRITGAQQTNGTFALAGFSGITGVLPGANGGMGVANAGKTVTLGGNLTTAGAYAVTFTLTGTTGLTLPTAGTLAALGGTNTWTGTNTFNSNLNVTNATLVAGGDATNSIFYLDSTGKPKALTLTANQSIRRNAANTAFEAYDPASSSLPSQAGHAGQYAGTDGTTVSWSTPSGAGNVVGPGTVVTGHVATYADTSGTLLAEGPALSGINSGDETLATIKAKLGITTLSGANTGDQPISITGDGTAGSSTGVLTLAVTKLNGTLLSGLSTGLLKNTTTTGVPSIAVAGTDYLAPAAIGSTVQAHDTDLDTWATITPAAGVGTYLAAGLTPIANGGTNATTAAGAEKNVTSASSTISGSNIDWTLGTKRYKTLAANTTFTFSNVYDQTIVVFVTNTTSNYTVTWTGVDHWQANVVPVQTTGAHTDIYTFIHAGGVTYATVSQNF